MSPEAAHNAQSALVRYAEEMYEYTLGLCSEVRREIEEKAKLDPKETKPANHSPTLERRSVDAQPATA